MDPSSSAAGGEEGPSSSKITRVRFSKEQLAVLEEFFASTSESPAPSQLEELSKKIDTTVARVRNWFGTRRAKKRKGTGGDDDEPQDNDEGDKTPSKPAATPVGALTPSSTTPITPATSALKRKAPESPLDAAGSAKAQKTEKAKAKAKGKGKAPEEEEEEEEEGDLSDMELIAAPLGVDWAKVSDVSRLQGEVQRLTGRLKETEEELKRARVRIKELEKGAITPAAAAAAASPSAKKAASGDAEPTAAEIKQAEQVAGKLKKSIPTQLMNQMVYRPGLVSGSSRLSAEVPNVSLIIFKSLVGNTIFNQEFAGKKLTQYKIALTDSTYGEIFSKGLHKSLRYGAHLAPNWPLNLTFNKGTQTLTVKGSFTMIK